MALFQEGQDPRRYFVTLIREQARDEGLQFRDFEEKYISLTERGDDEDAYAMLNKIKRQKFDEFDSRIAGLAWRAYQRDLALYPETAEAYQRAIRALAAVDIYPNLGMFVNCIALEKSPEDLARRTSWPTIVVVGGVSLWVIYLVVRSLFKTG